MTSDTLAGRFRVMGTRDGCDRLLVRVVQSVAGMQHKSPAERWALVRRAIDEHTAAVAALWHDDPDEFL